MVVFCSSKVYFYIAAMGFFSVIKLYVIWVLMGKEKTDDLQFIEEDRKKLIEERRKVIEERRQRIKDRDAVIIKYRENGDGGLQGFDGIRLFKDISCVYTCIAEEFYRIKVNGEIIKENLANFVKLGTIQSVNFIKKKFFKL